MRWRPSRQPRIVHGIRSISFSFRNKAVSELGGQTDTGLAGVQRCEDEPHDRAEGIQSGLQTQKSGTIEVVDGRE